jgi:hypothetical protein
MRHLFDNLAVEQGSPSKLVCELSALMQAFAELIRTLGPMVG